MSEKVVDWFRRLEKNRVDPPARAAPRPRVKLSAVVRRYWRIFAENLGLYEEILRPMRHNPEMKFEQYYAIIVMTVFIFEETGGIVYDVRGAVLKALLLSFVDQIVDCPEMGIRVAFDVGFYIFRDVKCDVPELIAADVEHVRRAVRGSPYKAELFKYMMDLGKIEKRIEKCRTIEDYRDLRLHSNCQMIWDMFDWGSPEIVFALNCAGVITDDVMDMATDAKVYITRDNLDGYIAAVHACLHVVNSHLAYDISPYFKLYTVFLKSVATLAIASPADIARVTRGARVFVAACFVVLLLPYKYV